MANIVVLRVKVQARRLNWTATADTMSVAETSNPQIAQIRQPWIDTDKSALIRGFILYGNKLGGEFWSGSLIIVFEKHESMFPLLRLHTLVPLSQI